MGEKSLLLLRLIGVMSPPPLIALNNIRITKMGLL